MTHWTNPNLPKIREIELVPVVTGLLVVACFDPIDSYRQYFNAAHTKSMFIQLEDFYHLHPQQAFEEGLHAIHHYHSLENNLHRKHRLKLLTHINNPCLMNRVDNPEHYQENLIVYNKEIVLCTKTYIDLCRAWKSRNVPNAGDFSKLTNFNEMIEWASKFSWIDQEWIATISRKKTPQVIGATTRLDGNIHRWFISTAKGKGYDPKEKDGSKKKDALSKAANEMAADIAKGEPEQNRLPKACTIEKWIKKLVG